MRSFTGVYLRAAHTRPHTSRLRIPPRALAETASSRASLARVTPEASDRSTHAHSDGSATRARQEGLTRASNRRASAGRRAKMSSAKKRGKG